MTPEKANELLARQALMGGGYNRNDAKHIQAEVHSEHGQTTMGQLKILLELEPIFVFNPGTTFTS